jgi:hypothetical protein
VVIKEWKGERELAMISQEVKVVRGLSNCEAECQEGHYHIY